VIGSADEVADWLAEVGSDGPLGDGMLLEERVDFVRELAVLVARSPSGQAAAWPVVQTVQTDSICTEVLAPAPGLDPHLAAVVTAAGLRIAGELDVTGVLAVEMFEVRTGAGDPAYVVNELAMRPHNSGHWSIEGAVTSQFENHLRAVCGMPLGSTAVEACCALVNLVGRLPDLGRLLGVPEARVHLYGKAPKARRKLGHVTVVAADEEERDALLAELEEILPAPG